MIRLGSIFLVNDVDKRARRLLRGHPNDIGHENNNRGFHFLVISVFAPRISHRISRQFASGIVMLPSIIKQNLTKSLISLESGRLEAARPPPSIPPVIDVSNRFNEAASAFFFCRPFQLERGWFPTHSRQLRRKQRRLARFDAPLPHLPTFPPPRRRQSAAPTRMTN